MKARPRTGSRAQKRSAPRQGVHKTVSSSSMRHLAHSLRSSVSSSSTPTSRIGSQQHTPTFSRQITSSHRSSSQSHAHTLARTHSNSSRKSFHVDAREEPRMSFLSTQRVSQKPHSSPLHTPRRSLATAPSPSSPLSHGVVHIPSRNMSGVTFTLVGPNGYEREIKSPVGRNLRHVFQSLNVQMLPMVCNGQLQCSTCHIHLPPDLYYKLNEPDLPEIDILEISADVDDFSRLACQVRVTPDFDGQRITIPDNVINHMDDPTGTPFPTATLLRTDEGGVTVDDKHNI